MAYDEEYAAVPERDEDDLTIKDMLLIGITAICMIGAITVIGDAYKIPPCEMYYDTFP